MDYSPNSLQRIEELARSLTPLTEIGVLLGFNEVEFHDAVMTPGNPARTAYLKGYATTALEIRKRNIELAEAGSPAADEQLRGYMRKMMIDL